MSTEIERKLDVIISYLRQSANVDEAKWLPASGKVDGVAWVGTGDAEPIELHVSCPPYKSEACLECAKHAAQTCETCKMRRLSDWGEEQVCFQIAAGVAIPCDRVKMCGQWIPKD